MERTQIYLTPEQKEALIALSGDKAIPMAELIRNAIDEYLTRHNQNSRRQMILESFGAVSDWNTNGEIYTREMRTGWSSGLEAAEGGEKYGLPD